MSIEEINRKNYVLIQYLKQFIPSSYKYEIWAEYDTDNEDVKVIVVQEQTGQKTVLWNGNALNNYYSIDIFGDSIREAKEIANMISTLIGKSETINLNSKDGKKLEKWQIIFKQYSNPQTVEYQDVRRVSYNAVLQCIIGKVYENDI